KQLSDLLSDIYAAMKQAVDINGEIVDATAVINVDLAAGRFVFSTVNPADEVLEFVTVAGGNANLLGFAGNQAGDTPDLKLTTRDGTVHSITLDTATTIQDIINAVDAQTGGDVGVEVSANMLALELVDKTTGGTGAFKAEPVNGSGIATSLGWVNKNLPQI